MQGGVKAAEQSDLAEGQQKVLAAMGKMLGLENEVMLGGGDVCHFVVVVLMLAINYCTQFSKVMNEATNLTTSKLDINDVLHSS